MTAITLFLTTSIFSQSGLCVYKRFHPGQHCCLGQTCFSHSCSTDLIPDINNRRSVSASLPTCMVFSGTFSRVSVYSSGLFVFLQVFSRICVLHVNFVYGHLTLKFFFLSSSFVAALCATKKPQTVLFFARLCPRLLNFHLWFLHSPLFWLQARALVWPHPGQSRTHLNHFWISACCLFCGAVNVAQGNFQFSERCLWCFLALASPKPVTGLWKP